MNIKIKQNKFIYFNANKCNNNLKFNIFFDI